MNIQLEENCEPAKPSIPKIHLSGEGPNMTIPQDLTNQETIVLSLLAMGYDNGLIIDQLCISKNTLKTHLRNVYSKLGVNDRTQAALWALKSGIIGHFST